MVPFCSGKYDAQNGRIPRAASMVYELPVGAVEEREYKMLPLPTADKRPILEGAAVESMVIFERSGQIWADNLADI